MSTNLDLRPPRGEGVKRLGDREREPALTPRMFQLVTSLDSQVERTTMFYAIM